MKKDNNRRPDWKKNELLPNMVKTSSKSRTDGIALALHALWRLPVGDIDHCRAPRREFSPQNLAKHLVVVVLLQRRVVHPLVVGQKGAPMHVPVCGEGGE